MKTTDKMQVRIIILLIIVVLFAIIYALYMRAVRFQVSQARETLRAKGYPVTLQELDRFYPQVPDSENAALVYLNAFSRFSASENTNNLLPYEGSTNLPSRTLPIPDNIRAEMKRYLDANGESLRLLREGAKLKKARYPIELTNFLDSSNAYSLTNMHLGQIRRAMRLLALNCSYHADQGHSKEVLESLEVMLALNASMDGEPILISILVQIACHEIFKGSFQYALNRLSFSAEEIRRFQEVIQSRESQWMIKKALLGEQAFVLAFFSLSPDEIVSLVSPSKAKGFFTSMAYQLYGATGVRYLEEKFVVDLFADTIESCDQDYFQVKSGLSAHELKIQNIPKYYLYSRLVIPAFGNPIKLVNEQKANSRLIQTALAVELFRLKHNRIPEKLDNLVPEFLKAIPLDPFDGKQIRFQHRTQGYVLYSIGPDEKDDGGNERKWGVGMSSAIGYDKALTMEK